MDFMKWLNSLGDLLYEVMSWLIFYPITLWRTMTNPLAMMRYSDAELHDQEDEQFDDTLNPPLFLVLSLLLTQALDTALGGGTNPIIAQKSGLAAYITDSTTLLALRLILFSLFPLMYAARLLRAKHVKLTRKRVKPPFYAQCYACAPFSLFLGVGMSLSHIADPAAQMAAPIVSLGALLAYLSAQTLWFMRNLNQHAVRGLGNALRAFFEAALAFVFLAILIVSH